MADDKLDISSIFGDTFKQIRRDAEKEDHKEKDNNKENFCFQDKFCYVQRCDEGC